MVIDHQDCLPCTNDHHTHHRRRDHAEAAIQNGETPLAMPAWYDRAPGGVIPSPPRILFDNPDREGSNSEPSSGSSGSEREPGSNSQPRAIIITPRDERATEIVPWVRRLPYGDRLRLARFTSQVDRDSLVMREPAFQLHLRQALQMRLTSLTPAHVIYRQREMRAFGDFASGLPVGLAELSANVINVTAWGQREYMMDIVRGMESWNQARQETRDFISEHGRNHPFIPELLQWLMRAGRGIFGVRWERAQLVDHPATLRTSRHPVREMERQVEPVQSLATGPTSVPSPGTMHAYDTMYWARMNQLRRSLQNFPRIEMERDLIRRAAWGSLHRPVSHNGRRNAISGPSGRGVILTRGALILTGMRQSPRIQVAGVNDSPNWVVRGSEDNSTDGDLEVERDADSGGRESEEGYTAGSEGSEGDPAEEEILEGVCTPHEGNQGQGATQGPIPSSEVRRRRHTDSIVSPWIATSVTLQGQNFNSPRMASSISPRSSSETPPLRTSGTSYLDLSATPGIASQQDVGDFVQTAGTAATSRAYSGHTSSESPSQMPRGPIPRAVTVLEILRSVSEFPQEMDIDLSDNRAVSSASEPLPRTNTNVTTTNLGSTTPAAAVSTATSSLSESLPTSENLRSTSDLALESGVYPQRIPAVPSGTPETLEDVDTDINLIRSLYCTPSQPTPSTSTSELSNTTLTSDSSRNTSEAGPERAIQPVFAPDLVRCDSESFAGGSPETTCGGSCWNPRDSMAANDGSEGTATGRSEGNAGYEPYQAGLNDGNILISTVEPSDEATKAKGEDQTGSDGDEGTTETIDALVLAEIVQWEIADMEAAMRNAGVVEEEDDGIE
ncbi:hypothetical protein EV426DRAFT_686709 [Tirmania nivea]|nr:hypothetical protein EV426DRAFT_686709 [Tirmania nivea]